MENKANNSITDFINSLRQGQRLPQANILIGQAIMALSDVKKEQNYKIGGQWILDNAHKPQHEIDQYVSALFNKLAAGNEKVEKITKDLAKGLDQTTADNLIAELLEITIS